MKSLSIQQLIILFAFCFGTLTLVQSAMMYQQATDLEVSAYEKNNTANETKQTTVNEQIAKAQKIKTMVVVICLCYAFLLFWLLYLSYHNIINPARNLEKELSNIAKGDFTTEIHIRREDEIGAISKSAQQIVHELGQLVRQITSAGMQVSAHAHAMLFLVDDNDKYLKHQNHETSKIVSSIEQLASGATEVEARAGSATTSSSEVRIQAEEGERIIAESLNATLTLANELEQAGNVIDELASSSESINQVMSVIQGIAEQTNLLALNAAIEAARAGEQGRGFAVVADEVRSLAQKTQESASQIEGMVAKLQDSAGQAVNIINHNQQQARSNADAGQQASNAMQTIFNAIAEIDDLTQQISHAASSQTDIASDAEKNIHAISELGEKFNNNAAKTGRFSARLSDEAKQFSQLSSSFNI